VQPTLVVHIASVWRVKGRSSFTVSGWHGPGAWEAISMAIKIYNLCHLNHRAHSEHREYRAFLPFSVSSVNSVVNIGMIFYPTYSSMKHAPLMLHSL